VFITVVKKVVVLSVMGLAVASFILFVTFDRDIDRRVPTHSVVPVDAPTSSKAQDFRVRLEEIVSRAHAASVPSRLGKGRVVPEYHRNAVPQFVEISLSR
jgi:hypothetical protein